MRIIVLAFVLVFLPRLALAEEPCRVPRGETIEGTVERVFDGDTFLLENKSVRLFGLDAPDRGLKGYVEARKALQQLALRRDVSCVVRDYSHDRCVAVCSANGVDLSAEMIRGGYAFAFRSFSQSSDQRDNYNNAEQDARNAARGLWRDAD